MTLENSVDVDGVVYTKKELHLQYAPNLWTRNGRPAKGEEVEVYTRHYQKTLDGTKDARAVLRCSLNHPYGSEPSQVFDIYGIDLPANAPVFFFVHGGGWQMGTKNISGFFAPNLHSWGCRSIIFGYSLAPEATLTDMVRELKIGLETAFKLYPKANFIIGGHSAGAQLVSCIIHDPELNTSQIKNILLLSGIYDLRFFGKTMFNAQTKMSSDEILKFSSPLQTAVNPWMKKQSPKILIAVGKHESPEFVRQARICHEHLALLGLHSSLFISNDDDHFTIIETLVDSDSPLTARIKEFLDSTFPRRPWFGWCNF